LGGRTPADWACRLQANVKVTPSVGRVFRTVAAKFWIAIADRRLSLVKRNRSRLLQLKLKVKLQPPKS